MDPLLEAFDEAPAKILASDESCLSAAAKLESVARYVAQHLAEREDDIDNLKALQEFDPWPRISALWEHLAIALQPSGSSYTSSEDSHIQLALALAKLHRNLLAGLESHQRASVSHEPSIRAVLFNITTFARIEDARYHTLQAVTTQLLSNLISPVSTDPGSDEIVNHVLRIYLSGGRTDDIVIRLLDSSDPKTNLATLTLIANSIRSSESRQKLLLSTQGVSWISKILDKMDSWNQSDDGRFELGYTILEPYLSSHSQNRLFDLLSDASEPITPSQTTLLKLLDPYIVSPSRPNSLPSPHSFLIAQYHRLTSYALGSIRSGRDDPRLAKVFEGLILICESLSNIGLAAQTRRDRGKGRQGDFGGDEEIVRIIKSEVQGEGIVPPLIGLLRELDRLLPRVRPGRRSGPAQSNAQPEARIVDLEDNVSGPILQIKQHLLQLLSVITYQDIDVGDQVRACGGVELVLSLTEFDESNPLLRERALFVVRNLLLNNPANQAIISKMDPVGIISDETGEILPLPEKMRKTHPETGSRDVGGADHDNGDPS